MSMIFDKKQSGVYGYLRATPYSGILWLWISILLTLLCDRSQAALEVDFVTNRGTITATLEYQKAPKACANLIGLATASKNFIHPVSGAVQRSPFLNNALFYQLRNLPTEKWIETGSPTNAAGGGPGYQFPDEINGTLIHEPYVLSMVSDGPNTNGSRFCFTGNVAMPARDGVNVMFGKVTSTASRAVIDAVLAAGAGASSIQSILVRRTDPAAMAFDVDAVGLPQVIAPLSPLAVIPGVSVSWMGTQPAASVLRAHQSQNLSAWTPHFRRMVGLDDLLPVGSTFIDAAALSSRFYHFSLVQHPGVVGASSMRGRQLTIESPGAGQIVFQFNAAGTGGSYQNFLFPGEPAFFSGSFTVMSVPAPQYEPYSFRVLLNTPGLGGASFVSLRGGYDTLAATKVTGRQVARFSDSGQNLIFEDRGTFELKRP